MTREGWAALLTPDNLTFLARGLLVTLELLLIVGVLSILLGALVAAYRALAPAAWRWPADIYVAAFRNFPVLVVMLFVRFGLPLLGVSVNSSMAAAVIAFTLYSGAMIAEVYRGAIGSVSRGQLEAVLSSGCSRWFGFTRVVFPQAMRFSYPGLAGQMIILLQGTSLVTMIGLPDLLHNSTVIYARALNPLETLTLVGLTYYLLCTLLARMRDHLERRARIT